MTILAKTALLLSSLTSVLATLPPIAQKGSTFVDSKSGERFALLGVDYQPGGQSAAGTNAGDPLSDPAACLRDATMMQILGVNTIRIYNIDASLDHNECMSIFDTAGIYVVLDVNTPVEGQYMDRSAPWTTYTKEYLTHVFQVIEAFKSFPNLLGFWSGNEIINTVDTAGANPPYIRAVQRDMKNYIAKHASRPIPVGYSAADVSQIIQDNWAYLQCDNGDNSSSDFFGLNDYEWCGGQATYESSGYNQIVSMFSATVIPVFFSEYGCNLVEPRVFDEVLALYGPNMTELSGGLVYEWTQEGNDFGLVTVNSNASMNLGADYMTLLNQYNKIDLSTIQTANNSAEGRTAPKCSSSLISDSGFNNSFVLPAEPEGVNELISNGVGNATVGTLVAVTATSVSLPVFNTNGVALQNLVLQERNSQNAPSNATIANDGHEATPTASSGSSTKTSKAGVAPTNAAIGGALAGAIGVLAVVL